MKKVNTLLIGVGYHARRIYVPHLQNNELCRLVACLDLSSQKIRIEEYLQKIDVSVPCYFVDDGINSDQLDRKQTSLLDNLVKKHNIEAVIISTEPLAHLRYALWALRNNLHILIDKPITTEIDVSTNTDKAKKLFEDYCKLRSLYITKNKQHLLVFSIQAQRRFHVGFQAVRKKIAEMTELTQCPVTSVQTFHSDGQWTFPNEFIRQTYHPYNGGYGKLSHSGYHSLDVALWLSESSLPEKNRWDSFRVYTQFVRPPDVLAQFSEKDYLNIFPDMKNGGGNSNAMRKIHTITGEVDAFTNISLQSGKRTITSVCCNTIHNGFSRRGWFDSNGRDLYKGNGRVRQESYIIEQGPFQSIMVHSLQAHEIQKEDLHPYAIGGEYHFDIHVFRNKTLFPKLSTYEFLNMQCLKSVRDLGYSRGHQEDARRNCVNDFYYSILHRVPTDHQASNILNHGLTTQVLSSIYLSAAKQFTGQNGLIHGKIKFKDTNR